MAFQPLEIDVDVHDTGSGLNCSVTFQSPKGAKTPFPPGKKPRLHSVIQYRHFPPEMEKLILEHWTKFAEAQDGVILSTPAEVAESWQTMTDAGAALSAAIVAAADRF